MEIQLWDLFDSQRLTKKTTSMLSEIIFNQAQRGGGKSISRSLPLNVHNKEKPVFITIHYFVNHHLEIFSMAPLFTFFIHFWHSTVKMFYCTACFVFFSRNKGEQRSGIKVVAGLYIFLLDTELISQTVLTSDPVGGC